MMESGLTCGVGGGIDRARQGTTRRAAALDFGKTWEKKKKKRVAKKLALHFGNTGIEDSMD